MFYFIDLKVQSTFSVIIALAATTPLFFIARLYLLLPQKAESMAVRSFEDQANQLCLTKKKMYYKILSLSSLSNALLSKRFTQQFHTFTGWHKIHCMVAS